MASGNKPDSANRLIENAIEKQKRAEQQNKEETLAEPTKVPVMNSIIWRATFSLERNGGGLRVQEEDMLRMPKDLKNTMIQLWNAILQHAPESHTRIL